MKFGKASGGSAKSFEWRNNPWRPRRAPSKPFARTPRRKQTYDPTLILFGVIPLGGQADFDFLAFEGGSQASNDFAGPELFTEENQGAVFESADGAEKILGE